jgi:hypothetical protein
MRFYKDGSIFKAVSISGPTHNYLGLAFAMSEPEELIVDAVSMADGEPPRLDVGRVCEWVIRGVDEANKRLSTSYQLKLIQFVVSDSPPEKTYFDLAESIVERMNEDAEFVGDNQF